MDTQYNVTMRSRTSCAFQDIFYPRKSAAFVSYLSDSIIIFFKVHVHYWLDPSYLIFDDTISYQKMIREALLPSPSWDWQLPHSIRQWTKIVSWVGLVSQFDEGLWQQWPLPSTEISFWHNITALNYSQLGTAAGLYVLLLKCVLKVSNMSNNIFRITIEEGDSFDDAFSA